MKKLLLSFFISLVTVATFAQYAGLQIDTIYHNTGTLQGFKTYRLYARFLNDSDELVKVLGGGQYPSLVMGCNAEMYQHPLAGPSSLDFPSVDAAVDPLVQYDSYVCIGMAPETIIGAIIPDLLMIDQGIDFSGFESGVGELVINSQYYMGWYANQGSIQAMAGVNKKVLIAQLTSSGDIQGRINLKYRSEVAGIDYTVVEHIQISGSSGCTDPSAINYDDGADIFDNSCIYEYVNNGGCTDQMAINYDPDANYDDGSCVYNVLLGCTDPTAENYNPDAIEDDGTCVFPPKLGCTDSIALNYDPTAEVDDGTCLYPIVAGCNDPEADNYDPTAAVNDESCIYSGCTDPAAENYSPWANNNNGTCVYLVMEGCTNPEADNYDPDAEFDNGTCIFSGCMDPSAENYDPVANYENGSCTYPPVEGCTNQLADNYNPVAEVDNGSCIISGCTDPIADNYHPDANNDNGTCIISGCTDPLAENYNVDANNENGNCTYPPVEGCTNQLADNYDQTAEVDNGTCIISGCTDPLAENFNVDANNENGTCTYAPVEGCTDSEANNYNPEAEVDNGSCIYYGCTNENALNYDPIANTNDDSCIMDCNLIDIVPSINQLDNGSTISLCDPLGDGLFEFSAYYTGYGDEISSIVIDWGDGEQSIFDLPLLNIYHVYENESNYSINITGIGLYNCEITYNYVLEILSSPSITMTPAENSNNYCQGDEITMLLSNWENNDPSTVYTVNFSDGLPAMIFNHPPPSEFNYTLENISCNLMAFDGTENTVNAKISAENSCSAISSMVSAIYVSGAEENANTSFLSSNTEFGDCAGGEFSFVNISDGYIHVSENGCEAALPSTWEISPNEGYEIIDGSLNDPNSISIRFNVAQEYYVSLLGTGVCGANNASQMINISEISGTVDGIVNFAGEILANIAVMAYKWSVESGEFELSGNEYTNENGEYVFTFAQGLYQIKAMPDMVEHPEIIPLYTNEVPDWESAEIFAVGCNTEASSVINLIGYDFSGFEVAVAGGVYYRDIVKNNLQGDPIPGIPIIVEKDTSNTEPIVCTSTDILGNYLFSNIPPGNYKLHVDIPGLPMAETHYFTIEEDGQIISGLNFYADSLDQIYITDLISTDLPEKPSKHRSLKVYPNPSQDDVTIELPAVTGMNRRLEIMDPSGRLIIIKTEFSGNKIRLDFGNLPSGNYHYRYYDDEHLYNGKIVILD